MILLFFGTIFAIQGVYWFALHRGFRKAQATAGSMAPERRPPVSVLVAARNEEEDLPALLDALRQQCYPEYEIVVVDDASDDTTPHLVEDVARTDGRFRLVRVTKPVAPRKKNALTIGVEQAKHELLALTDADCTPLPQWLEGIAAYQHHASPSTPILLVGYSPFRKTRGVLNALARYETFVTGYLTAAAIGLGKPYMAVGRNLSYPRSVFRAVDGFEHSLQSLSGDDDLFVQEVARREAARIVHMFDPRTFVPTDAPRTWRAWFRQKTRHTSASKFYHRDIQAHLAVFHTTSILLWAAPFFLGWTGAGLLATKLLAQWLALRHAARILHERDLVAPQPLLEFGYTLYTLLIAPIGVLRMPKRW